MNNCEYPAKFENDLIGVKCIEDIEHRKPLCFIPYKMIISVGKIKNHPVLKNIIINYPDVFSLDQNTSSDQICLTLFIFYQITLGEQSYWYPYLCQLPVVKFSCHWNDEDINFL